MLSLRLTEQVVKQRISWVELKSNKNKQMKGEGKKILHIMVRPIGNGFVMQLFNLRDRACNRERSERCPNTAVRWRREVEVGGGVERGLGGSCGETFLNEASERTHQGVGAAALLRSQKAEPGSYFSTAEPKHQLD